jgi:parallel beta-helix repeat protein
MGVRMKKLLASLILVGGVQAQMPPAISGGIHPGDSSASSAAPTAIHLGSVNVRAYLAPCSSSANVNVCATNAANQAKAAGLTLYFPAGTYPLSAWEPPCPLVIVGDGKGETIFQRPASSVGSVINSMNCGGLRISDLTIDGNKANNRAIGYTVVLHGNWNFTFDNVEIKNSKGAGSALTVQRTADDSNNAHSMLSKLYIHDNDGNGVYLQQHAWNWTLGDSVIRNNGGVGVTVIDYEFPPVSGQFSNCAILYNDVSYNTGMGISLTSSIIGGTSSTPSNGPFNTVQNCRILGNQVNHNGHYGIIMTGGYNIEIGSNIAMHNGMATGSVVAGINSALCQGCDVHDNTSRYNDFYGIDAGGAIDTKIRNNTITNNGNSAINNGNGINCGACQSVEIADNLIGSNGWTGGGPQIHVTTYDGGVSGFSISARNIAIRRNHLICANSNEMGLIVLSDPPYTTIEDNWTEGCEPFKGYVLHLTNAQVHRNRQDNWVNGVAFTPSSANAMYPDAVENITLAPASGDSITALRPYFYSTNYQTVYAVTLDGGGSNYSTSPTVSFSGGGCGTEPAGAVFQDNAGHIVGVILTGFGSRCTHAPTVLFTDSTGSGATATAYVLTSLPINGRTLNVLWPSGVTVRQDPNYFNLLGGASFTVPGGSSLLSTFQGQENHWIETARSPVTR